MRSFILGVFFIPISASAIPGRAQWTLRFDTIRAHASALTGCYGTASYNYVLPDIETLRAHRQSLHDVADELHLGGFAWSYTADPKDAGRVLVMDLSDGDVHSAATVAESDSDRGLVFCLCRYTQLKNCSRMALPALGRPFYSETITVFPQP